MAKRRWGDLSSEQQKAILIGGAVEVVVTGLALRDLARRPSSEIRGSKASWALSFVVQPFGPLAYFAVGRRSAESLSLSPPRTAVQGWDTGPAPPAVSVWPG
jgi:hypothetical protein